MSNLLLTVNTVLPVFLVMVVGFVCRELKLVKPDAVKAMNRLVFQVFLPVSLAKSLMTVDPDVRIDYSVMLYCAAGILATFFAGMLLVPRFVADNRRRGALIQGIYRSNYAILGIPLIESLFPGGDNGVSAMIALITVPLFNILAVITLETFRGGRFSLPKILIGIIRNPLILGCAAGFIIGKLPFTVPEFLMSTITKLGSIASPLALFSLGATIDLKKIGGNAKALLAGVSARLIIAPGFLLFFAYLLGYRGAEFAALMIAFGSPCAVSSYTMAAQMDSDEELAAQMVMLTTVFSVFTIFLMVLLFQNVGIFSLQ